MRSTGLWAAQGYSFRITTNNPNNPSPVSVSVVVPGSGVAANSTGEPIRAVSSSLLSSASNSSRDPVVTVASTLSRVKVMSRLGR